MEWVKFKKGNAGAEEIFKKGDAGTLSSLANRFIEDNGLNSPINSTTYKSKEHSNNPDSAFMGQSFFSSGFGTASKAQGESVSDTVNEKLSGGINEDGLDKKYESNVGKAVKKNIEDKKDLNSKIEQKDAVLQPIDTRNDANNNQQSVTNNSSSQNNEAPNNPDNINPAGQSSINSQVDSNESKIDGESNNVENKSEAPKTNNRPREFESNYQAPNAFAGNIHKTVGQKGLDTANEVDDNQFDTKNQLGGKKGVVSSKQNELDAKSKDKINKGITKNIGGSIYQNAKNNVSGNVTAVKNTYFSVTGQPEKKQEYSKIDKPAIDISGEDLKIQDNNDKNQKVSPQNIISNNLIQANQASSSEIKQDYEIVDKSNNSQSTQNSALKQNKNLSSKTQNEDKNIANLNNAENKDKATPNLLKQSSNNATSQQGTLKKNMSADKSGKKNNKNEDK